MKENQREAYEFLIGGLITLLPLNAFLISIGSMFNLI